jgi:alkylation response protein AidB-like acyl-CoA dehydrogenase
VSPPATATDAAAKHVASAGDAVAVAERLAEQFGVEASVRDADRDLPHEQVRTLKGSGLLALSVPAEYGAVHPDLRRAHRLRRARPVAARRDPLEASAHRQVRPLGHETTASRAALKGRTAGRPHRQ